VNGSEQPADAVPVGYFHTTHWTDVLAAGAEDRGEAGQALARLCQTYWLPIYAFIRKRGHDPHQAQDLTQEFFAVFLEKRRVAQAVRERGRFRSFLMTSVENFLRNANERNQAQKRGGGKPLISLDNQDVEALYLEACSDEADPAAAFGSAPCKRTTSKRTGIGRGLPPGPWHSLHRHRPRVLRKWTNEIAVQRFEWLARRSLRGMVHQWGTSSQ
jgi:DNA-directed RNA polymerase specialized sigma24 family protein